VKAYHPPKGPAKDNNSNKAGFAFDKDSNKRGNYLCSDKRRRIFVFLPLLFIMIFSAIRQRAGFPLAALFIGLCVTLPALLLKHGTEHYESVFRSWSRLHPVVLLLLPFSGLTLIAGLRRWTFRNRQNKGIREVAGALKSGYGLPVFKIPSHLINGFLTVVSGGSTGIEVSTVVAGGAIGSQIGDRLKREDYRGDLICAGIAAGITALFGTLFGGLFFVWEVLSKSMGWRRASGAMLASLAAFLLLRLFHEPPLFAPSLSNWHWHALPYFIILGLFAGLHAVYLTRCVLFFKTFFNRIGTIRNRILIASATLALLLSVYPALFGEGYHAIDGLFSHLSANQGLAMLPVMGALLLLKPVSTAVTLGGGGDGGVFAPSLFCGAFLGAAVALLANRFLDADVIVMNFTIVGMAAALSASIHAPLTALFAVCAFVGDYTLFIPMALCVLVSQRTAQKIFPFTVYTYQDNSAGN